MSHTIIRPLQDPRPDFFLGVALIFIFVGEMSGNALSSFTLPSTSYWNAAIIFIFVSGYSAGSYAGFWVTRRSGGIVCRRFDNLDAVLECDTIDKLGQLVRAFQPPPSFRCSDDQLEHHQPGGC